jgi:linoleoyl-CoA desaturase
MNTLPALKFHHRADDTLGHDLRDAAHQYLARTGQGRQADAWLLLKGTALLAATWACYLMALRAQAAGAFSLWFAGSILLGMVAAMNGLHDAAHGALFRSGWANRTAMRLMSLPLGIDTDSWTIRHVHFHHHYANVEAHDLDIEPNAFLRQTPFHTWHPQYRFQHLYWPLVAALSLPYLNLYADLLDRLGRTPVRARSSLQGLRGWLSFLGFKLAHAGLMLALPVGLLAPHGVGWGTVLAVYFGAQMLASCGLVALILGTHWAEVQFFQADAQHGLPHSWHAHAFLTTCDWLPRPAGLGYWLGGLNLHLTHHLFPTYSHRHYPALARLVAAQAARHGLAYRRLGYGQLLASQQAFLRAMGRQAPAA